MRTYLKEAFELAAPGTVHVVNRYRDANQNLRTQFLRILRRAGLKPWERLFHNLRSSRQTELTETYPAHVVASWMGNTVKVAADHYLQTTEAHFQSAAQGDAKKALQPGATGTGNDQQGWSDEAETPMNCGEMLVGAGSGEMEEYPRQESNL